MEQPALGDRIAMKTAGELVVDATPRHFFECGFRDRKQVLFFSASRGSLLVALQNQIDSRGVRKLRRLAEAAVLDVELLCDRANLRIDYTGIKVRSRDGDDLGLRDGIVDCAGEAFEVGALVLVGIGDGEEHAAKTGPPHLVFGRKVRSAEKWLPIREKKTRQRPAALAGERADRGLIARIHVRTFVAIYFHRHEVLVDDFGDLGVLVAFAVDYVAPVAPDRADVEEYGLVFRFGTREDGVVPFVPVDGLMCGRGGYGLANLSGDFVNDRTSESFPMKLVGGFRANSKSGRNFDARSHHEAFLSGRQERLCLTARCRQSRGRGSERAPGKPSSWR